MLWKRLRVLGSVAHYHPKCQSGTSAPHLDSVCAPVGKICIIRIVFQSLKVIAKGFYMGEHLSSNWNCQSIYLLHVKYLQKCSLLCMHNFSVDPKIFSPINTCSKLTFPFLHCFESENESVNIRWGKNNSSLSKSYFWEFLFKFMCLSHATERLDQCTCTKINKTGI